MGKKAINSIEAFLNGDFPFKTYPEHFYDYPETVQETLKSFYDIWKIPALAVPNKRQKEKFKMWIEDLQKIEDLCGTQNNVFGAFTLAHRRYSSYSEDYKFIIWRPFLPPMEKLLIWAMTEIKNSEQRMKEKDTKANEEKIVVASDESRKDFARDLKKLFDEDE